MEEIPDYLKPLEYITRPFPQEAVEAAIARREESIPHLLRALEWVEQHFEEVKEAEECHMLHIYALYLLAQFRETRAYPLIVRLFRHPEEDALNGDIASGGLSNMLASVCGGDLSLIKGLIEDGEVDEFVRAAAVKALGILTLAGVARPEETSGYFGTLHRGGLAPEPNYVWDSLISVCMDLGMTEQLDDIRRLYRTGIADPCCQSLEEVETEIVLPLDAAPRVYQLRSYRLIDDTVAEMKWWYCFTEKAAEEEDFDAVDVDPDPSIRDEFDFGKTYENRLPEAAIPYERESPKVGRNDPCPCGSGKKFKKCCGGA